MENKITKIIDTLSVVLSAEDKGKLADIANAYYATVDENFSLREENSILKQKIIDREVQIKELNDRLEAKQKLVLKAEDGEFGYYFPNEGEDLGPVCPLCYKKENAVVILENTSEGAHCPTCKAIFAGVTAAIEGKYSYVW